MVQQAVDVMITIEGVSVCLSVCLSLLSVCVAVREHIFRGSCPIFPIFQIKSYFFKHKERMTAYSAHGVEIKIRLSSIITMWEHYVEIIKVVTLRSHRV